MIYGNVQVLLVLCQISLVVFFFMCVSVTYVAGVPLKRLAVFSIADTLSYISFVLTSYCVKREFIVADCSIMLAASC